MMALIFERSFLNITVGRMTLWEDLMKRFNSVSAGRYKPIIHAVPFFNGSL